MKKIIQDISIHAAEPAYTNPLHFGRPNIGDRDHLIERLNNMLDRKCINDARAYLSELEQYLVDCMFSKKLSSKTSL